MTSNDENSEAQNTNEHRVEFNVSRWNGPSLQLVRDAQEAMSGIRVLRRQIIII